MFIVHQKTQYIYIYTIITKKKVLGTAKDRAHLDIGQSRQATLDTDLIPDAPLSYYVIVFFLVNILTNDKKLSFCHYDHNT